MLTPAGEGFLVEAVSAKGAAFVAAHVSRFADTDRAALTAGPRATADAATAQQPQISLTEVQRWLTNGFQHELWDTVALRCHGCGACAAVCPTCHCFDIVDEPEGVCAGTRRRNWDTCQTARFTVHASGHNPRADQNARFRQRVMHKFSVYPNRFGEVLCTGCGRCARACPGGMDLAEVLRAIGALAGVDRPKETAV